ncbi:hypothetical protein F4805DRAFT_434341 [Annulohypoxylon moriforme]|nr:hypothetical protein F4805DRAFT_434341 [Annulohypoxylon moriforme]
MNVWERFGPTQQRTWIPPQPNPAGYAPPFPQPGAGAHPPPPGGASLQSSYVNRHPNEPLPPPPPQPPYPPYGSLHEQAYPHPYGPVYGPTYGPAHGPVYGPAPPPPHFPGFTRTSNGNYIPEYNDPVNHPPSNHHHHHHGHCFVNPPMHQHPDYSHYQPQPPLSDYPPEYPFHLYHQPPPPPRHTRPPSRDTLRPFNHLPHWPDDIAPVSSRINHRPFLVPINQTPISLDERPETQFFRNEPELRFRLTPLFRPMVGVVGRTVQDQLSLPEQPQVKFDFYPVQVDERGRNPLIRWRTLSRAPVYCITLPHARNSESRLQEVADALKDTLMNYANPWYRQAGYVFRISRSAPLAQGQTRRRRLWVPPLCVYKYSRSREVYEALFVEVSEERLEEVDSFHDYGDTSEDDQGALVDEMWAEVRARSAFGPRRSHSGDF